MFKNVFDFLCSLQRLIGILCLMNIYWMSRCSKLLKLRMEVIIQRQDWLFQCDLGWLNVECFEDFLEYQRGNYLYVLCEFVDINYVSIIYKLNYLR